MDDDARWQMVGPFLGRNRMGALRFTSNTQTRVRVRDAEREKERAIGVELRRPLKDFPTNQQALSVTDQINCLLAATSSVTVTQPLLWAYQRTSIRTPASISTAAMSSDIS